MAARDRFEFKVTCPGCGKAETAKCSEDDYPFMHSPHFSVDELPGFTAVEAAETMHATKVRCDDCGERFTL